MALVRAVYRDGKLELLDRVDLQDGQEVHLQIVKLPPIQHTRQNAVNPIVAAIESQLQSYVKHTSLQDAAGDMLVNFNFSEVELDEDATQQALDQALAGKRPLSEIILEERREGR